MNAKPLGGRRRLAWVGVLLALAAGSTGWAGPEGGPRPEEAEWIAAARAGSPGASVPSEAPVRAAREALKMVVLGAGAQDGMRPGLVYDVMRREIWVARVRVLDVRDRVAGAVVEQGKSSGFPRAGDRAVVSRSERDK